MHTFTTSEFCYFLFQYLPKYEAIRINSKQFEIPTGLQEPTIALLALKFEHEIDKTSGERKYLVEKINWVPLPLTSLLLLLVSYRENMVIL